MIIRNFLLTTFLATKDNHYLFQSWHIANKENNILFSNHYTYQKNTNMGVSIVENDFWILKRALRKYCSASHTLLSPWFQMFSHVFFTTSLLVKICKHLNAFSFSKVGINRRYVQRWNVYALFINSKVRVGMEGQKHSCEQHQISLKFIM